MSEVTYLSKNDVVITNARAVMGGKTYAMANITSVSMGQIPANTTIGLYLIIFGIVIGGCGFSLGSSSSSNMLGALIFAALLIAAGVAVFLTAKPSYTVKLGSASGETHALNSKNMADVKQIVDAMNTAIINRG